MNVSLTDELQTWIEGRVQSGLYRSSSEVVREAIRLLREREQMKELRRDELKRRIQEGIDDLDAGRSVDFSEQVVADIAAAGRARLAHDPHS